MDIQFYGANCITVTHKGARIVIDDNLADLGAKSIAKPEDVTLYTGPHGSSTARLSFASPGEYEVSDISVVGIPAQAHIDELKTLNATILITGHIYPQLNEAQLEKIGICDVLIVPVGGNGYTVDPVGALKLIRAIEPKLVVPTHFADKAFNYPVPQQELSNALKELGMEPKETVNKLKLKGHELSDVTQLIIIEKS
jgi:L-ascorbate metabolism protein UlaG (beta-lactamase superfamily)